MEVRIKELEENYKILRGTIEEINATLKTMLENGNDFEVAVINGKTEYRKASELIGEMYLEMKSIKLHSVPQTVKNFRQKVSDITAYVTLLLLIVTFLKVWLK